MNGGALQRACPLALRLADAEIEQSQNLRFAKKIINKYN